ncbi:hypothetical protein [Sphaerisporangium sp. TRM90804]|uniref:hypothetical protein n=1 Tax=Sphaerisporangium sp. TRM90804 TaxID=3031113 RepID=UPI00244D3F80|nr:hypothetical protein [Sphaerisporangium sp. TRM90804]MDH2425795.1 hypothetical protein [Sphaerisporangium sp. TRM90804]
MDWAAIAVAAIGAATGIAGYVTSSRSAKRAAESNIRVAERQADSEERVARLQAEQTAYERSMAWDVGLQQRMSAEISRQARQIRVLERRVAALCRQLTNAGHVPDIPEEEA